MRFRQRSAGIAAALCAVLACGTVFAVAASADPSPLSPTSRTEMFELLEREAVRERDRFERRYPSLQIPMMTPMRAVSDEEWPDRMAECRSHFGIDPRPPGSSVGPDLNTSTLPREVVDRTCQLRYPKRSALRFQLGPFELQRLWGYLVFELQPCLSRMGVAVSRPPSLAEYVATGAEDDPWHPYAAIPESVDGRDARFYDDYCPRFPAWLR